MTFRKSIKKNYIYNLMYQIIILIIPLITTPYVSKVLEADGVGTYGYILSIVTYFILFGSLGVAMYGQREIAYVQENKEKRSKVFLEIVILRLIAMSISIIIYYVIFGRAGNNAVFYRIFILEMIANMFDISWFFQGLEEFKKTVLRNVIVKIIGVISIFIFVKSKNDLNIYILIYVLANLLGNLSLWLYLPKYINKISITKINLLNHLKPIILMFVPQIAIQIYTVLDKTMIGIILNDMNEVGYYEQAQKVVKIALALVTALGTVMSPRIAFSIMNNKKQDINKYLLNSFRVVWLLGSAITFGIIAIANNMVPWFYGDGYEKVKILLMVLAPLNLIIGLNNVSGVQYLIQVKKQNIFSITVIIGAAVNFLFNFIGIKYFKSVGAASASVVAEIVILILQLIYMKKKTDLKIISIFTMSVKYLISGILMGIVIFYIGKILPCTFFGTLVQISIGGIIYFLNLIILRDEYFLENSKNILNKIIPRRDK